MLPPSLPTGEPDPAALLQAQTAGLPMVFGKYTLLRRIANGGMAELFLAMQKSVAGFEKLLVIKRILPSMNQDRGFIEMLLHEARIAATLSHPNIVQIYDVGSVDGQYFIAMEHVHGEDLRSIVRQMKKCGVFHFPLENALSIVHGIAAGLADAHEKRSLDGAPLGIVHRDISPQNVVVAFAGDVKIVDFGIAKSDIRGHVEMTRVGRLKGKVPYMSPEQARGEALDARSDVFATGILLFELTTGKRLFKGQSEYETLRLICDREYPRPTDVSPGYPPALERIVLRALARDRAQRYPTARELQLDLEELIRTERIAATSHALARFMQSLFADKLERERALLKEGRHLADVLAQQSVRSLPESSRDVASVAPLSAGPAGPAGPALGRARSNPLVLAGIAVFLLALAGLAGAGFAAVSVRRTDPATGRLEVQASSGSCVIAVDEEARGVTPIAPIELPAGEHRVRCTTTDGRTFAANVTVTAGAGQRHVFVF